jgi:hypothetical protein
LAVLTVVQLLTEGSDPFQNSKVSFDAAHHGSERFTIGIGLIGGLRPLHAFELDDDGALEPSGFVGRNCNVAGQKRSARSFNDGTGEG